MPDDTDKKERTPVATGRRRPRREKRRAGAPTSEGNRVLDVYGTVTGNGTALDTDAVESSLIDALR